MQILAGFSILAIIGSAVYLHMNGLAETERKIARWLLADARGWDSRALELERSKLELQEIQ